MLGFDVILEVGVRKRSLLVLLALVAGSLACGAVAAQTGFAEPNRQANSDLAAAQHDLDQALAHLRKVHAPHSPENMRAMGFINLAQEQLQAEGSLYPIN